ncbi:hypothetical protein ACSX1A_10060 [Pontibacter sp. MBLB2868]|uniref:hypothetical protein n=1 Tax=Pontibacter sp. MBLB2868 TaxID=3451555 RepID=UPI003F75645D
MPRFLMPALKEFESLVTEGKISTFHVFIRPDGILLRSAGNEKKVKIPLHKDILSSLRDFFLGIDVIEFGSFDYTNLNCFMASLRTPQLIRK